MIVSLYYDGQKSEIQFMTQETSMNKLLFSKSDIQ